ncbi:succinylglutamate desuccinylase/aspartoacylase family protein [bacterium]|nr:succinylglutamate desuccinylase/aspartoacylase family protein [bacterium]
MAPTCELGTITASRRDGAEVRVPYWHLQSGQPGEVLAVTAAQHGNEVQGCEVVRALREVCERDLLRGEVYLIPFTNLPAVQHRRSHTTLEGEQPYGEDLGENMNRTWPGDPEGNDTERLSHAIHQAVISRCDHVLDLHSWSRFTATCTLVRAECANAMAMADAAQIRFTMKQERPQLPDGAPAPIGVPFNNDGRGALCIELAPQWVIREKEVRQGLRAATNIAKLLHLMDGEMERIGGPLVMFSAADREARTYTLRAPRSGLFVESGLETSDRVEAGQKLGHLICDDDLTTVDLVAPVSGYLWQYGCHREHSDVRLPAMHPYADGGDILAAVMTV